MLPLVPDAAWKPTGAEDPTLHIVAVLATCVGLPYFVLSATGPLLQAWYAKEFLRAAPYRLFALSNLGSMLALLSYPVLLERSLALHTQSLTWSLGYLAFASGCGAIAWRATRRDSSPPDAASTPAGQRPPVRMLALWTLLAFCPSALLLAVTSHLTENVAPIPFLWILPLAVYLLSFILCFESSRWYKRRVFIPLFVVGLGAIAFALAVHDQLGGLFALVALLSTSLFVVATTCHGELAALKPDPRFLTLFYLMISAGGMLGGVFVGLIAPRVFDAYYELPIGVVLSALAVALALRQDRSGWLRRGRVRLRWAIVLGLVSALALPLVREAEAVRHASRLMARNFYGALRLKDAGIGASAVRTLYHGRIIHGMQFLAAAYRHMPTTYYTQSNGVGMAILGTRVAERGGAASPQRVGVVGLGAGTLAAYGRRGDFYRFYEINPLMVQMARERFWFLKQSAANTEIALGDARLSLGREPPQRFDVLAVDAFSGDSIPVHLLTKEAFALYFQHLRPGGVLAVHVSNKFLDLAPVVLQAAEAFGKRARSVDTNDEKDGVSYGAQWILVTGSDTFFSQDLLRPAKPIESDRHVRLWTDDFASVYQILR